MRIELPMISRGPEANAHPYPFRVAFLTKEFLQGILFIYAISDMAAGDYVRQMDAMDNLRSRFDPGLLAEWQLGWKLVGKYAGVFEKLVSQNALIAMTSQWDWYVRKRGGASLSSPGIMPEALS